MARPLLFAQGASQEPNYGTFANRPTPSAAVFGMLYIALDQGPTTYLCVEILADVFAWLTIRTETANALAQTNWFVDPVNGSDFNTGTASTQGAGNIGPLKTATEVGVRLGVGTITAATCTVTILGQPLATDIPVFRFTVGVGCSQFKITGASGTTAIYTSAGGPTTVQVAVASTNTDYELADTALPAANSVTGFLMGGSGKRGRVTSGARAGNVFGYAKDLGAKTGRITTPMIPSSAVNIFSLSKGLISVGDPYVVEQLPTFVSMVIDVNVDDSVSFGGQPKFVIDSLAFTDKCIFRANGEINSIGMYGCDLGGTGVSGGTHFSGGCSYVDCWSVNTFFQAGVNATVLAGGQRGGVFQNDGGSNADLDIQALLQGVLVAGVGSWYIGSAQAWDSGADGFTVFLGSGFKMQKNFTSTVELFGSGNAGAGLRIFGGGLCSYLGATKPTVTGTGGNCVIGTGAGTAKTWAQVPVILSDIAAGTGTTFAGIVVQ